MKNDDITETKIEKQHTFDWICGVLCAVMLILLVIDTAIPILECKYRFLTISASFWRTTGEELLIPMIPVVLCGILGFLRNWKYRRVTAAICTLCFFPLMFRYGLVQTFADSSYAPAFRSETTSVKNFGQYDDIPELLMQSVPQDLFPREIPDGAENVQYRYRYGRTLSVELYLAVSWQVPDASVFSEWKETLEQYGTWEENAKGELVLQYADPKDDIKTDGAVILCPAENRVYYVAVSTGRKLPAGSDEVWFAKGDSPYDY